MKNLIEKILGRLQRFLFRKRDREQREREVREEIQALKDQISIISNIVKDQSGIIVSLAKVQSDLCKSLTSIESSSNDENCFLIKIPLSADETVN